MADRVRYPPGASKRLERMLRERERLERQHLKLTTRDAIALSVVVRSLVERFGTAPWSLDLHARVTKAIRSAGRQFGGTLSAQARTAAHAAAVLGAEQQPRALAIFASAALGQKIAPPAIDTSAAIALATPDIDARTEDVGARAGEDAAQAVISASYLETRKDSPLPAVALASGLAALALNRARERAERVIVTEMTAGAAEGGDAARVQLATRVPRMRKVWDATLDRRVCATCSGLHHQVVDAREDWPGGIDDAPAHARCRCATMPWLDDWTVMLDELGIAPGPRTGVQEFAEARLPSFGTTVTSAPTGGSGASPPKPPGGGGGGGSGSGGSGGGDERDRRRALAHAMGVRSASPADFKAAFDQAFMGSDYRNHVTHYTEEQLREMRVFLSADRKTGVALHDHFDGRVEATALFNVGDTKGAGLALLEHAIDSGANYVECYGPNLNRMYEKLGFEVVDRFPFDASQAAPGWDYAKFGRPDYFLMRLPGGAP